jgi:hypothetical protein
VFQHGGPEPGGGIDRFGHLSISRQPLPTTRNKELRGQ